MDQLFPELGDNLDVKFWDMTTTSYLGNINVHRTTQPGNNQIRIMEGTFAFTAIDYITNTVVHITDGKYRISY